MARINQAMQDLMRYNAALLPQNRTDCDKSHSHATTFDSGYLIPIMTDRVLPGDEKKIRVSALARMATPLHPVMDQANLDIWCFYVPDRLWWNHAKEFYGENLDASFNPDGEYQMPSIPPSWYMVDDQSGDPEDGIGSLKDYFGFPFCSDFGAAFTEGIDDDLELWLSAGKFRCYQLIWNEWFRNSSVVPALRLNTGDTVSSSEWAIIKQKRLVMKNPDYFTSALREPQAGNDVLLPLGEWAPVVTRDVNVPSPGSEVLRLTGTDSALVNDRLLGVRNTEDDLADVYMTGQSASNASGASLVDVTTANLWADLTSATAATINNLRAAITVQQLLERDAIGGKRYQNLLYAHWGVFTPDATLQRPELLGASRTSVGMRQVLSTSAADGRVGDTGAVSVTSVDNEWICNKAFTEPGWLMCLAAVRPVESYSQGIDIMDAKLNRYDHYYPVFDRLGNQPIQNREIYMYGDSGNVMDHTDLTTTFGWKEAWIEYKIKQNRVTGLMRPGVPGSLATWNYSSYFSSLPILNSQFVSVDPTLIDRTIAVQSEPQFLLDVYFEYYDTKSMSAHSTPGLLML